MRKYLIGIAFIFLLNNQIFSQNNQTKEYKFLDKTLNADIDYKAFYVLDTLSPGMSLLERAFRPIKGDFIVYRFLAIFKGVSFTEEEKEFHDILIVKTDSNNKIIHGYQYTLEWAEPPLEYDLFKSHCKNTYLKDSMNIKELVLKRIDWSDKNDIIFKEDGIIKLK